MSAEIDELQARAARDMGYNVPGWIEEIYEGAEILIPDTSWMLVNSSTGEPYPKYTKLFATGTVRSIQPVHLQYEREDDYPNYHDDDDGGSLMLQKVDTTPHFVVHFLLETDDGLMIHKSYGKGWEVFFRIPVD